MGIKQRLQWVKRYETSGDAGFVCRRCGISRPTLRKGWRRYLAQGAAGLESHSRRPKRSPSTKTGAGEVTLILALRTLQNLGARRIQSELKRLHSISLAMATIHKVLCQNQVKPVVQFRRKADFIRYERPVPGDRVQMEICKIGPGLYPSDIRKAIYTTNAIESLNSVIRQAIKKRKVFPTDDSVRKVIYLATRDASKKWRMPLRNWRLAMSRFIIEFGDRLSDHL